MLPDQYRISHHSVSNPIDPVLNSMVEKCAIGFIEDIWNNHAPDKLLSYLHPNFVDHTLPDGVQNAAGLSAYLNELRKNIQHHTTIENLAFEEDFVVIKVKIKLCSLPDPNNNNYRNQQEEIIIGYRILAMFEQRIIGHWEFLDPL